MTIVRRRLSKKHFIPTPESTGNAGAHFEGRMQAFFAVLMLCNGELSVIPHAKISKLEFQVRAEGFRTDDLCVICNDDKGGRFRAFVQIKRNVEYVESNPEFKKMLVAAWKDYNLESFNKECDAIIFLTGPVCRNDSGKLGWLCRQARTKSPEKFVSTIYKDPSTSKGKREFYYLVKRLVGEAEGKGVADERIYVFLRRLFEMQPDSMYEGVLADSLAFALLSKRFGKDKERLVFDAIKNIVDDYDESGGDVTCEVLLSQLKAKGVFVDTDDEITQDDDVESLIVADAGEDNGLLQRNDKGSSVSVVVQEVDVIDAANGSHFGEEVSLLRRDKLALLSLVGMWHETDKVDRSLLCSLLSVDDKKLDEIVQDASQVSEAVNVNNGIVVVNARRMVWRKNARFVSQAQVKEFIALAHAEFSKEEQGLDAVEYIFNRSECCAGFASTVMREGLAKGMALLAVDSKYCQRLAFDFRDRIGRDFIKALLHNKDWHVWATIDNVLPYIAEIDPEEFLTCLRKFLGKRKKGLEELYSHECGGVFARSHMTGLIRALETIVWLPGIFCQTINAVVEMAKRDPGGNWIPRPLNVFHLALHPVAPHTWATPKRRVAIVKCMVRDCKADMAWKLIVGLLPSGFYSYIVTDNHPLYRANNRSTKLANRNPKEVYQEFDQYAQIAVSLSGTDPAKICELVKSAFQFWTNRCFDELIKHIGCVINTMPTEAVYTVWLCVRESIYYADMRLKRKRGGRTTRTDRLTRLVKLENDIRPNDPLVNSRILFSWRDCLYSKQLEELTDSDIKRRQEEAVSKIKLRYGVLSAIQFAGGTDKSTDAGYLLGKISNLDDDNTLLPSCLATDQGGDYWAIQGYVSGRYEIEGQTWISSLGIGKWDSKKRVKLFTMLPFKKEVWKIVGRLSQSERSLYWSNVCLPRVASPEDLITVVEELLNVGRGYCAIDVVGQWADKAIDCLSLCRMVIKHFYHRDVVDKPTSMTAYYVPKIIKCIQSATNVPEDEKVSAEWMFIDLANKDEQYGFRTLSINAKLASDPAYFCEALSVLYLPEKEAAKLRKGKDGHPLSAAEKRRIENVWKLLDGWDVVPGIDKTGEFHPRVFNNWVKKTFALARKMDRLESAKRVLARVFVKPPKAKDGFWMDHAIAKELEKRGNDVMLHSYGIAMYNSRGVHAVDKSGKEDKELAGQYVAMAEAAEDHNYFGIARELRTLAKYIMGDMYRMQDEDAQLTAYFDANAKERDISASMETDDE